MPEFPDNADNHRGGTSDYWDGFVQWYWGENMSAAFASDAMSVSYGGGRGASEQDQPMRLRYMDDAYAAGVLASDLKG